MKQKHLDDEIDEFTGRFIDNPRLRPDIVAELISGNSRIMLNIPRYGRARRISGRLRDGTFSDYFEFEKILARTLHPVLAGLNLNIVSDMLVNSFFSEKYHLYARDVNMALAVNKKLTMGALKDVILKMAAEEGHFMVIKFYDLVLRGIDAGLWKAVKPVEAAVIQMKTGLVEDEKKNRAWAINIFIEFRDRRGAEAAGLMLTRIEWDDELNKYIPRLMEEAEGARLTEMNASEGPESGAVVRTGGAADGPEEERDGGDAALQPGARREPEDKIARYARLIRRDYLDAVDPDDDAKVRGIMKGIYLKNEKVYGSLEAADVVKKVLAIWIGDSSLDERVRRVLADIAEEEEAGPVPEDYGGPEVAALPDEPSREIAFGTEADADELLESDVQLNGYISEDSGVSSGGMDALPDDISDEAPTEYKETDPLKETDAVLAEMTGAADIGAEPAPSLDGDTIEDEAHLLAEEQPEAVLQEMIDEGTAADEKLTMPDEAHVVESAAPGEGESFIVKDELLFEDKTLFGKLRNKWRKTANKARIKLTDIADTGKSKNLLDLMDILGDADSAVDISPYILGSGLTREVSSGVSKLLECEDFEEAYDYIIKSGVFDYREKIILLEKWLKVTGGKRRWIEQPKEGRLAQINKMVGFYVNKVKDSGEIDRKVPAGPAAVKMPKPEHSSSSENSIAYDASGLENIALGSTHAMKGGIAVGKAPVDIPQKPIIKTGDESIRLSHEIEQFQSLYSSGMDGAVIAERLPHIQGFFDGLAAGEESAVHFAVYHKPAFITFINFINEKSGLKELLDIQPAMQYCKKKKII